MSLKRRDIGRAHGDALAQDIPHAEAGELGAVYVNEDRVVGFCCPRRALDEPAQTNRRVRPDGTNPNLVTLPVQSYLIRCGEPHVADLQIKHLLR